MTDGTQRCRLCGAPGVEDLGAIPDGDYFAGRVLPQRIPGGRLLRCSTCRSMFRHPVLPSSEYVRLYQSGVPTQWSGDEGREDLRIIRSMVTAGAGSLRVLDVGCGTGNFLDSLPSGFLKFGVEPSSAATHAVRRGINILAQELQQLPADAQFDVITIIDVIEHVADPGSLLTEAYCRTAPGGKIIVSTGNPELALWWRVFKSRFWYASFPEHLSFPSIGFCRLWCEKTNAFSGKKLTTRYQILSRSRVVLSFVMQMVFYISPSAFSWIGQVSDRVRGSHAPCRQIFAPGIPGLFADHHILTIEKPLV
jgi:SAM-dependent methyltransferase